MPDRYRAARASTALGDAVEEEQRAWRALRSFMAGRGKPPAPTLSAAERARRYRARKRGEDVAKQRPGPPSGTSARQLQLRQHLLELEDAVYGLAAAKIEVERAAYEEKITRLKAEKRDLQGRLRLAEQARPQASPASAGSSDDPWSAILALCPPDKRPSLFRVMAKAFHPDQGGNGPEMAALAAAWERHRPR